MDSYSSIVDCLRKNDCRMTVVREAIIRFFVDTVEPVSADDILEAIQKTKKLQTHKVTIYRELDFLVTQKILQVITFGDRKQRYELADRTHHHHVICVKCNQIKDVLLDTHLSKEINKIETEKKFKITSHSLEFFGVCKNCLLS